MADSMFKKVERAVDQVKHPHPGFVAGHATLGPTLRHARGRRVNAEHLNGVTLST